MLAYSCKKVELTPFGKKVRSYRIERYMRLYDMAKFLQISSTYLSGIETGKHDIPDDLVDGIAFCLNLNREQRDELKELANGCEKNTYTQKNTAQGEEFSYDSENIIFDADLVLFEIGMRVSVYGRRGVINRAYVFNYDEEGEETECTPEKIMYTIEFDDRPGYVEFVLHRAVERYEQIVAAKTDIT